MPDPIANNTSMILKKLDEAISDSSRKTISLKSQRTRTKAIFRNVHFIRMIFSNIYSYMHLDTNLI